MAYFDFENTPIMKNITLKMKWCEPVPAAIRLTCSQAGDISIANQWDGTIFVDGEPLLPYKDNYGMGGDEQQGRMTIPVEVGQVVEIAAPLSVFQSWGYKNEWGDSQAVWEPLVCSPNTGKVSLWLDMDAFLRDGKILPKSAFPYFFSERQNQAITRIEPGSFDTSHIEEMEGSGFSAFVSNYSNDVPQLPPGSFQFPNLKKAGDYAFAQMFAGDVKMRIPAGSFSFPNLEEVGRDFCSKMFSQYSYANAFPKGCFSMPKLKKAGGNFFETFLWHTSFLGLPAGSFNWGTDLEVTSGAFLQSFASSYTLPSMQEGNRGVQIYAATEVRDSHLTGSADRNPPNGNYNKGDTIYVNMAEADY